MLVVSVAVETIEVLNPTAAKTGVKASSTLMLLYIVIVAMLISLSEMYYD